MLSPADAALVARDRAIPGLALLLDPEAFAAELRRALPEDAPCDLVPYYVRYKPGTNCLVAYQLTYGGRTSWAYARGYAAEMRDKLAHARGRGEHSGATGSGALVLDEPGIAVYSWPYDRQLRSLPRVRSPRTCARLVGALCPQRPDLSAASLVHLRYRPERRYVGRLAGATRGDALLKLYCAADYGPARAAAGAFQSGGPLALAAPIGADDERCALLFPWRPGQPLAAPLWAERDPAPSLRLTGAALATLHAQVKARLPTDSREQPLADLEASARTMAAICPDLMPRVEALCAALAATHRPPSGGLRPLHGDFYADQVLIAGTQATLLDLDNARWGDPAADIGTFVAHLQRAVACGQGAPERAALLAEALCEGYAEVVPPPDAQRVRWHTALGLLRLAPEPFRYRAPEWPLGVARLVAAAEVALRGERSAPEGEITKGAAGDG